MRVLVDTNIWSLALRRNTRKKCKDTEQLTHLILAGQAVIIGAIRQELLSGISSEDSFAKLKAKLDAFDDFPVSTQHHIMAAQYYNLCRRHGIQGSMVDFLICAVAVDNDMVIYTNDKDFDNFARCLPLRLLKLA